MAETAAGLAQQLDPETLQYDARGLLPVVVQDQLSGAVLMLAYADKEAVQRTLDSGLAHFWSRSRQQLWQKGETSGNVLRVISVTADCDRDALLYRARPAGPTCHRGTRSCFEPNPAQLELGWLSSVLRQRQSADPESSYTARLLARGVPRIAQKVGEEATETVIAAMLGDAAERTQQSEDEGSAVQASVKEAAPGEGAPSESATSDPLVMESADLLYHLMVLLQARKVDPQELANELGRRHQQAVGAQA